MIERLSVYSTESQDPYRNLAIELGLTMAVEPGECILFLWQNRKTVVIGKNQNCWRECRVSELEAAGGHLARRLSGGGAVFHDLGNLNFTFCVREEDEDVPRQMEVILRAVRGLGIEAAMSGRNDLTAQGRKFSGNAFCRSGGRCCHHGTLLVDVDRREMERYLNVRAEKLRSNGVESVRSRTVNLKELCPGLTIPALKSALAEAFAQTYGLPAVELPDSRVDWSEVERWEAQFASWEWKYGRRIAFQNEIERRFPWGGISIGFNVEAGVIREARVYSDAMDESFPSELEKLLTGCRYDTGDIVSKLDGLSAEPGEIVRDIKEFILSAL